MHQAGIVNESHLETLHTSLARKTSPRGSSVETQPQEEHQKEGPLVVQEDHRFQTTEGIGDVAIAIVGGVVTYMLVTYVSTL